MSHRYLGDEIRQLRGMGSIGPAIFLSVAAFLLNVVVSRVVRAQREQIAALKAFGYSRLEIGKHYLKLVLLIALTGAVLGTVTGAWMGHNLTQMYTRFYKFPLFEFHLQPAIVLLGLAISAAAAILGTLMSVRSAVLLPPAEAMRPEPPADYRPTLLERTGLGVLLSPAGRMILRNLERGPLKAILSCLGIAMAVAVLILGSFMEDALDYIIDFQFRRAQRQDVMLTFLEPTKGKVRREVQQLPGVLKAEFFRTVPTRLRFGHTSRRVAILGLERGRELYGRFMGGGRVGGLAGGGGRLSA
jgi:putative ABC transport system permease protein